MIIRLAEEKIFLLTEETRKKSLIEVCGLLFGHMNREEAVVEKITMTHNVLESPITFQVDPEEFLRALVEAEKDGLELVGFFHSHPLDASPSDADLAYMRLWPDSIWLIISSISYDMSAYQIKNGSPLKVRIEVSHV